VSFYGFDATYLPAADPRWHRRYRELFNTAAVVLAEGPVMAETIASLGCPATKIRVHHLGVTLDELPFRTRRWSEGEPMRVLLVGSFREKKGLPYALEALAALAIERDLAVTVIGDADHTSRAQAEKQRIVALANHPALRGRVRLLGYQSHARVIAEAYAHHIFLAPSVVAHDGDAEGGAPVTLIELAATGMPVVASRHCDIPAILKEGESGLLCPERDVDSLVAALRRLAADPQKWEPMAKAARRHIEVEFDAATQGSRLADLYGQVAA
jgi:colanic acid/amylovoran biosynthesis glycosyltransferase